MSEGIQGKPILVVAIEDEQRDYHDVFNAVHKVLCEPGSRRVVGEHRYFGVYMLTAAVEPEPMVRVRARDNETPDEWARHMKDEELFERMASYLGDATMPRAIGKEIKRRMADVKQIRRLVDLEEELGPIVTGGAQGGVVARHRREKR